MEQLLICLSVAFVLLTVGLSMVTFDIGPIHCGFAAAGLHDDRYGVLQHLPHFR